MRKKLGLRAGFTKLFEMEREFGRLRMATIRRKTAKADTDFPRTFSFRGGLKTLIGKLSSEIGDGVKLSTPVTEIEEFDNDKFRVNGVEFDAVVISTPSFVAADLIKRRDEQLAGLLAEVNYPHVAVVVLGFKSEQINAERDGLGFCVPSTGKRPIMGKVF